MRPEATLDKKDKLAIGLNLGNTLNYLSHQYADPPEVIREFVQNSIDKKSKHILVLIDQSHRVIKIYDDGLGASYTEISQKFGRIAETLKSAEEMGEKAIGNLAGLSISQEYRLLTKARNETREPLRMYSLGRAQMIGKSAVDMDVQIWPGKHAGEVKGFRATTMVQLVQVNERALQRLNNRNLVSGVLLDAFRRKIREENIDVRIVYVATAGKGWETKLEPGTFSGTKMDVETYTTPFGKVEFEMYFSQKPKEEPKIHIEHRAGFSFSLSNLPKKGQLGDKPWDVFKKGYFEGVIRLNFGTISADRAYFEWDEALIAFNTVLEEFALEILGPLVQQVESEGRTERYKRVSEDVLKKISAFYQENPDKIPDILRASQGSKETLPGVAKNLKDEELAEEDSSLTGPKKLVADAGMIHRQREKKTAEASGKQSGTSGARRPSSPQPTGEAAGKVSDGRKRITPHKGNSLEIVYVVPDEESGMNWYSRRVQGATIEINVQNSYFGHIERMGMTKLREYVLLLVQKELTCASLEPTVAKIFNDRFEDTFLP